MFMVNEICIKNYKSVFGELVVGSYKHKLCLLDRKYRKMRNAIDKRIQTGLNAKFIEKDSSIIEQTILEINEYSKGKREIFDIPLLLVGTEFQKNVWNALLNVPYGKTASYLKLSKRLNNPKAVRAVATANGANAISIIVPCHRIIGSNGSLVGYAGGISIKQKLLELENPLRKSQLKLF